MIYIIINILFVNIKFQAKHDPIVQILNVVLIFIVQIK